MRSHFIARLRARCRAYGFTLVELMITLAVAAILAMIAVPSFKHILISTNLSNINNDLAADLQYARTEAVSRQVDVAVAQSGGSWQNGWLVQTATATPTILRRHPAVSGHYVVTAASASSVTYVSQGTLLTGSSGVCFTIHAQDDGNNDPRFLQVFPAGMLKQTTGGTTPTNPNCTAP